MENNYDEFDDYFSTNVSIYIDFVICKKNY